MAQNLKGWGLQEIAPTARSGRILNGVLTPGVGDLVNGAYEVTSEGAMYVKVGSGTAGDVAYVEGVGGIYAVRNPDSYIGNGIADVPISTGDATYQRHDIVVLRVYDNDEDASGQNGFSIEVVEGVPASVPADPVLPSGTLALARITVPVGESTSIDTGDITDLRVQSSVLPEYLSVATNRLDTLESLVLGTLVGDGNATTLTLNLPSIKGNLIIEGRIGHNASNNIRGCRVRFNGDPTGGNYEYTMWRAIGASASTTWESSGGVVCDMGRHGAIRLMVPNYATSHPSITYLGEFVAYYGTTSAGFTLGHVGGRWSGGNSITSVTLSATDEAFDTDTIVTVSVAPDDTVF